MKFQLLGPLEVENEAGRIPLGGPKQRLVLAHLILRANSVVSAELLIDEIWGDEPPDAARPSLQSYVSHLRKALGSARLEGRSPGYVLHVTDEEVDARRFELLTAQAGRRLVAEPALAVRDLRQALAMWHGQPLADLAGELSLQPELERLLELRLSAQEDLIDAELALGRHAGLIPELGGLVGRYPLRERLSAQLMLALYRAGRQADALNAYHRLRNALDEELGIEPSPQVESLQRKILSQDPALDLRGEPLRGYRIVAQIGAGPFGRVHRALDPHTEREIAIKVLGGPLANEADFVRRFEADAARVSRLEHPHIVPLLDWWREPDAAYLVMRLMTGGSLVDRLTGAAVDQDLALRWVEQIGSALGAAHRQAVLHGDLRPGNVLFDAEDNAYLSDFLVGSDAPPRAGSNASAAADPYLAPERREGAPTSVATDVYAFGRLLADLLLSLPTEAAHGSLAALVRQCTAAAPDERPSSATDVVTRVREIIRPPSSPIPSRRIAGPTRNPYKGLRAFEEADEHDFVGREDVVRALASRIADADGPRLLAVVGPSGSGKSSVVNAGLLPALRAGLVPGSDEWFVAIMTPGPHPFEDLERALMAIAVDAPASFAELLRDARGLRPALERVLPGDRELLLIIDQFEELFTLSEPGSRDRFLDALAKTVGDAEARVRMVITLRADFYDRPLRHERFGRHLAAGTQALAPMTPEQLERAITEPAERAGLSLEAGLVPRIVAETSNQPGALPMLQYALAELWERRDGSRLLRAAFEASGGIAGAVSRRAEQLVKELDDAGRIQAQRLFLSLIEPGEGQLDTARRARVAELEAANGDSTRLPGVIEDFARYRLLLLDRDPVTREPTVELAHEALLRAWPRLQQWVDEMRDDLRLQRRLAAAAEQWAEGGRDPSFLLTGSRLQQAEAWAATTGLAIGSQTQQFVVAGVAERDRVEQEQRTRLAHEASLERRALVRLRGLVVVLGIGGLLAAGLSVYAVTQSNEAAATARIASARELAAAAIANLDVDAERSVLLALKAVDVTRSVDGSVVREAEEALHRAIVASRVVLTVGNEGGEVDWARTPDGRSLFVTQGPEESGTITIRDATTGDAVTSWRAHGVDVNDVSFSADGSMLATTGDDGTLKVWRLADHSLVGQAGGDRQAWGPSFSPDGSRVAAAWPQEGVARILDLERGTVRVIQGSEDTIQATSFSPDGRELAVAPVAASVRVLSARSLETVRTLQADGISSDLLGFEIAFSPDGRWIASASDDGNAKVWDAGTGELRFSLAGHSGPVMSLDWTDDSAHLVTGSADGTAIVWEVGDAGYRRVLALSSQDLLGGIAGVAVEPNGDHVLLAGNVVSMVKVFDAGLRGDAERANIPGDTDARVAFTSDTTLAAPARAGSVTVWDTQSGDPLITVGKGGPGSPVYGLDASPDRRRLAIFGADDIRILDSATGGVFHRGSETYVDMAWGGGGSWIAGVRFGGSDVDVLDGAGRPRIRSAGEAEFFAWGVDVRQDGLMAVAEWPIGRPDPSVHRVTLRDTDSGKVVRVLATPGLAYTARFDPSGQRIALPFLDGRVEIWDLETDRKLLLSGHIGEVRDVAFNPDGTILATAGDDGTVRLWDAQTGAPRLVLRGHTTAVSHVRFSPDGSMLASTGQDGITRLWTLDLDQLINIARQKVTRDLTDQECREYLHVEACPNEEADRLAS